MDWKQFIVGLVSHLSWPLVVLLALIMFRIELTEIAQRLAHFKFKGLELDFDRIKERSQALQLESPQRSKVAESPIQTSLEDQIFDNIDRAPMASILLAWSAVESAISTTVARLAISPESPSYRSPSHNIDMLVKTKHLSEISGAFLNDMRILRNRVSHEPATAASITSDQAKYYAEAALEVTQILNAIGPSA